jgi:hypothetical protein
MSNLRPHVFVLCYPRVVANVEKIIGAMAELDCKKTVIDASKMITADLTGWEYIGIVNESFYGRQFEIASRLFDGDVFICITGDAECEDWVGLVRTCVARFETIPQIGVWSPDIDNTGWSTARVSLGITTDPDVHVVAQTDSIVWALRPAVVTRLQKMNLFANNLGWGVDWMAILAAYTQGLVAVRDKKVAIHHPVGRIYSTDEALVQMEALFDELSGPERAILCLLHRSVGIHQPFQYQIP